MGKPHMAVQQETELNGCSMKTIRKFWGKPLSIRKETPNQLWTYHQNGCTTLIYFNENNRVNHAESRGSCSTLKFPQTDEMNKEV